MMTRKKWLLLFVLFGIATGIRLVSLNHLFVEKYYSNGLYPFISNFLKYLTGWLPFSIGDVIYAVLIVWGLLRVIKIMAKIFRKQYKASDFRSTVYQIVIILLAVYILFNFLWGLNYNRKGIVFQLGLKREKYAAAELMTIDSMLVNKINESKTALLRQQKKYPSTAENFDAVALAYKNISRQYPWLVYHPRSVKSSLWGWAGNYIGFTGYYNPFTGEAQANTTGPKFTLPFTACHEVAHQLGYAKENEANFVGYLAAVSSADTLFHYSAYLDLFLYTQRSMYLFDSTQAKYFSAQLIPEIKADLKELAAFYESHQSPLRPLFKWAYDKYLQKNEQPAGILTYDEVTALLIAYYKKNGRI